MMLVVLVLVSLMCSFGHFNRCRVEVVIDIAIS